MNGAGWIRLPGPSTETSQVPATCPACGCKEFFSQPDFRRSLGVWIVSIASVVSFALLYFRASWLVMMSPMVFVLVVDRLLNWTSPIVLICYKCEMIFRGLPKAEASRFDAFDLEIRDRYLYSERQS